MSTTPILFRKARNPGYVRKDGTYVRPFNDRRAPAQLGMFGGGGKKRAAAKPAAAKPAATQNDLFPLGKTEHKAPPACAQVHPQVNDKGKPVVIDYPSAPSSPATWASAGDAAVFVPGGPVPAELHGVRFAPWDDVPEDEDWDFVDGQNDDIPEPPLQLVGNKRASAGVIVQEPDGRVWLISPTNQFGGVMHTFPKGGKDKGMSLQSTAIREAFEESGLKVQIDAHAIDVERSTSIARYYFAHRVGGTPAAMGWESQAVRLVPVDQLGDFLNRPEDRKILELLRSGGPAS